MAASLRALGAHLGKKFLKRSSCHTTGGIAVATGLHNIPKKFNMLSARSFSSTTRRLGIWIPDYLGLKTISKLNMMPQGNNPSFRLIGTTKCNLGSSGHTIMSKGKVAADSTKSKLSLNTVRTSYTRKYSKARALAEKILLRLWTTFWKSIEEDFIKKAGQYIVGGSIASLGYGAYFLCSLAGLDVQILDKFRSRERVRSEENKRALSLLSEILERKDSRLRQLEEDNNKIREDSQRDKEEHKREISDLKGEVRDLKAAIHVLQEDGRRKEEGFGKEEGRTAA